MSRRPLHRSMPHSSVCFELPCVFVPRTLRLLACVSRCGSHARDCPRTCGFCKATAPLECSDTAVVNLACPNNNIARLVPTVCDKTCAPKFVQWWDKCLKDTAVTRWPIPLSRRARLGLGGHLSAACLPDSPRG